MELIVIPVTRQEHEFRHHPYHSPIGFIAGSYSRTMSAAGHFVCKIGFPTVLSRQPGCHRDIGVSHQQVIRFVFKPSNLTEVTTVTVADEIGFHPGHF